MSLQLRWVGESDLDRVAQTRTWCYGGAAKDLPYYQDRTRTDTRATAGDYLLAEQDGNAVGTATSYSMSMWLRGARVPCQGVAWVGTIKTHRRGARDGEWGIASQIMHEALRIARERQQIVSALMPFRGSFYEHFGYGVVERHNLWTVPLAVLPTGRFDGMGFMTADDLPALKACRQRQVERGMCDIERSTGSWDIHLKGWEEGLTAVDRAVDGQITGYIAFMHEQKNEKDYLRVSEMAYNDFPAFNRLLHFLASLRDQYTFATLRLPVDLPLNRLLREVQIPHRLVNHAHAELRTYTRMSIRVLDHRRLIEAMRFPSRYQGKLAVAVHETEGDFSRFEIELSGGRATTTPTESSADIECTDRTWAAIVSGDLPAKTAMMLGLLTARREGDVNVLEAFGDGPAPFCQEYF